MYGGCHGFRNYVKISWNVVYIDDIVVVKFLAGVRLNETVKTLMLRLGGCNFHLSKYKLIKSYFCLERRWPKCMFSDMKRTAASFHWKRGEEKE